MAAVRPLTFFDVTVPVTTVPTPVVNLIVSYFAANRPEDLTQSGGLDFTTFSRVQFTADRNNGAVVIVVGDYTATYGTAPTPSQGTELIPNSDVSGIYTQSYSQVQSIDLTQRYAVASANGGFLHIRADR